MSSPDNRPARPAPQLPEPIAFPAVVQDEQHTVKMRTDEKGTLLLQVEHAETVIFSAAVTAKQQVQLRFDGGNHPVTPQPLPPSVEALPQPQPIEAPSPKPAVTPVPLFSPQEIQTTSQESREKNAPIMLIGRFAKTINTKPSPSGGTMATFRFAEHPSRDQESYYNTLSEDEKKAFKDAKLYYIKKTDTFWWPVTAFDEKVALIVSIRSDDEYRIFCYPQWLTETTNGKEETSFTLNLVGVQPVKQIKQQAAK